jgi:hypothetical protein
MTTNSLKEKLKQNPVINSLVGTPIRFSRYVPAKFSYLLEKKPSDVLPCTPITPNDKHYFFGYYDKTPWDKSGRYMLCVRVGFSKRMAKEGEKADICLIDLAQQGKLTRLGTTTAWSWQQGCMLQWIDYDGSQHVLYNDYRNGEYVTVICDIRGKEKSVLCRPTYALSPDNQSILSVDFDRLHYCRPGYGYVANSFNREKALHPDNEGIYRLDVNTNKGELIVSLNDIVKSEPNEEFKNSIHHFICLMYRPDAKRFGFYHRWRLLENGIEKTRMYTAAHDGSDRFLLNDYEMVSHYSWMNNKEVFAWANHPTGNQKYYLLEDKTEKVSIVGNETLTEDGHPSFSPSDDQWLLTDTYPDKNRCQNLYLFNMKKNVKRLIGRYFVPFGYDGPVRCDLHPRWSPDGKKVCFDSTHEGMRRVYVSDVSSIIGNEYGD